MKTLLKSTLILLFGISLLACQGKDSTKGKITVGTIAGPESRIMETAKTVAKDKYNLDIHIIEFNDYNLPNAAVADGSIDANMFQHQPYLDASIKAHGYKLVSIGKTFLYPMGAYSKRWKSTKNLPHMGIIAIPNDPSNEGRALLLLQKEGIITLTPGAGLTATPVDIIKNKLQLNFKELDAAQLPRVLDDVDLALINTNFAIPAGLLPKKDALILEDADSPYANIVVVRKEDANNPAMKQ